MINVPKLIAFFLVPLCVAFFNIAKSLINPSCASVDLNDDVCHTFPQLFYAFDAIRRGQLPLIGLYNNFGQPIIGDALTYPFAPHAFLYWFFPPPIAMLLARFLISFATVFLLTVYFERRVSLAAASFSAVFAMYALPFFWFLSTHHYQLTLSVLAALLIVDENWIRHSRRIDFFKLWVISIVMCLGVSINLVVYIIPVILIHHLILRKSIDVSFVSLCLAILGGLLFIWPDLFYMLKSAVASVRIGHEFVESSWKIYCHVFWMPVLLAVIGMFSFFRGDQRNAETSRLILLGLAILLTVIFLKDFPMLWKSVPFLKNSDIFRPLWLGNVFIALGIGVCLDFLWKGSPLAIVWVVLGLLVWMGEFLLNRMNGIHGDFLFNSVPFRCFLIVWCVILILLISRAVVGKWIVKSAVILLALGALFFHFYPDSVSSLGYFDMRQCRSFGHFYSNVGEDRFSPRSLLKLIPADARLVFSGSAAWGHEFRLGRDRVFGGAAMSINMNDKKFYDYLSSNAMIHNDDALGNYHFISPWRKEILSDLGIRFILDYKDDENMVRSGWKVVKADPDGLYLWENPLPTSVVYFLDKDGKKSLFKNTNLEFKAGKIIVHMEGAYPTGEVVVAFINRQGWRVVIDGSQGHIHEQDNRMMRVDVPSGSNEISFTFEPVTFLDWGCWIFLSVCALIGALTISKICSSVRLDKLA